MVKSPHHFPISYDYKILAKVTINKWHLFVELVELKSSLTMSFLDVVYNFQGCI